MMHEHLLLPGIDICSLSLPSAYKDWLEGWLRQIEEDLEQGDVSSSACLMGVMTELVLQGSVQTDWCKILDDYLTRNGMPIAYSEAYGKRLHKFSQWRQTPVHCIHTRWWIERVCGEKPSSFAGLIQRFVQPNGWIYNPQVSETRLQLRMESEYMMSMAMGLEILACEEQLQNRDKFIATLASKSLTKHLSAEYFRIVALRTLGALNQAPCNLAELLSRCETETGYSDFSVESKVDDYMGSAKRVSRDKVVPSPLASLYAGVISERCEKAVQDGVREKLRSFGEHLKKNPEDIPPFQIRDIPVPFGPGLSPLEVIAASYLVSL